MPGEQPGTVKTRPLCAFPLPGTLLHFLGCLLGGLLSFLTDFVLGSGGAGTSVFRGRLPHTMIAFLVEELIAQE